MVRPAATTFRSRHRPRQYRRDRHGQQREPRHRISRPRTSRSPKTGGSRRCAISPPAIDPAHRPRAAPRPPARRQREHGRGHRVHADRRDQVPEHPDRRRRHHRRRLRHPGPGRPVRTARICAADRADPPAEDRRQHGALRRHRRVSRRRRRPDRPQDHAALHRRRRHAQRDAVQRAARSAEGVGRHRLCRSACSSTRRSRARRRSGRFCSRLPRPPAARRSSRCRSRTSTRFTRRWSPRSARSTRWATCRPTTKADGTWRKVEIKVSPQGRPRLPRPVAQGLLRALQKTLNLVIWSSGHLVIDWSIDQSMSQMTR